MSPIERSGGGGAASAGGLVPLFDSGYLAAPAATLDTGAAGIAAGHFCLIVIAYLRSTNAVTTDNCLCRFNNDSSALYNMNRIQNVNATVGGAANALQTAVNPIGDIPGASATASLFGSLTVFIPAYDGTTNFKTGTAESHSAQSPATGSINDRQGFTYQSASAISRLALLPGANNWATGSRLVVYGTQ